MLTIPLAPAHRSKDYLTQLYHYSSDIVSGNISASHRIDIEALQTKVKRISAFQHFSISAFQHFSISATHKSRIISCTILRTYDEHQKCSEDG
jgi:hypothetical protein